MVCYHKSLTFKVPMLLKCCSKENSYKNIHILDTNNFLPMSLNGCTRSKLHYGILWKRKMLITNGASVAALAACGAATCINTYHRASISKRLCKWAYRIALINVCALTARGLAPEPGGVVLFYNGFSFAWRAMRCTWIPQLTREL